MKRIVVAMLLVLVLCGCADTAPQAQLPASPEQSGIAEATDSEPVAEEHQSSGTLGDYFVEIKGAELAEAYDGTPAIVVTYEWTNNSDKTTSAMWAVYAKAFQSGIEMDDAIVTDDRFEYLDNKSKDVRPGTTITVQEEFDLTSDTDIVEFELTKLGYIGNDPVIIRMDFDPVELRS